MDVTSVFITCVKALRIQFDTDADSEHKSTRQIFPLPAGSEFMKVARLVGKSIKEFDEYLGAQSSQYLQGSFGANLRAAFDDQECNRIDTEAENIVGLCKQNLLLLSSLASAGTVNDHVVECRSVIATSLSRSLTKMCSRYAELKALRMKRAFERRKAKKLTNSSLRQTAAHPGTELHEPDNCPPDITEQEKQMFDRENQMLFDEMDSMAKQVVHVEQSVLEITRLQQAFADKVLEQQDEIDNISRSTINATENVKQANDELRSAIKSDAGFRVWILFFLVTMSLSILFLHWYNP